MKGDYSKYISRVGTAIDRFIKANEEQQPTSSGELSQLLRDIVLGSKIINREINRAGLLEIDKLVGESNPHDEPQKQLDLIAHARFVRALSKGKQVFSIISEEYNDIIYTDTPDAKYCVAIDPLDGSSNIGVNVSLGTIFSIYKKTDLPTENSFLIKGAKQVAAGYILYGSSTMLVFTTGQGVYGFTYEPSLGEYFLSHPNITINEDGRIYSINEGYYNVFPDGIKKYLQHCHHKNYSSRYIGSLVADFHRNLLNGGIFLYPSTQKYLNGKLRLMYECNALAFIVEQAGGQAIDGKNRVLDIIPAHTHQTIPFFIGSNYLIEELLEVIEM